MIYLQRGLLGIMSHHAGVQRIWLLIASRLAVFDWYMSKLKGETEK